MYQFYVDAKKAQQIPASLKEWCAEAHQGPRALVAGLEVSAAPAPGSLFTLKGYRQVAGASALSIARSF